MMRIGGQPLVTGGCCACAFRVASARQPNQRRTQGPTQIQVVVIPLRIETYTLTTIFVVQRVLCRHPRARLLASWTSTCKVYTYEPSPRLRQITGACFSHHAHFDYDDTALNSRL
ncbi:hypothetical protein BJ508DRAFT_168805 [Ascobolus immersus RN42]|uniref:Uncharacterized protein n=1 Tax=Ascobolus immersus RN42 TaxID=1160509 RepID=A0A3N4IJ31_ASCIM|nr:hypothetical protein BJ508DRAFT_168805 [Ascobolus immersus RN42]